VDNVDGSAEAKKRVKVILETIAGERSVAEACEELAISEARFHELRSHVLTAAVEGAESGRAGRPPKTPPEESAEIAQLKAELTELRIDLQAARIREEIAIAMPHLLKPVKKTKGKNSSQELFGRNNGTRGE
jgi:hypothetical protein